MAKEICISSTPHETRLAILEDDQLTEIYYERENEYTLAGSIYKGRVTRVLPGMQSAFVDIGLERDAFLYVTDFLEEQEDSADFERVDATAQRGASRSAQAKGENSAAPQAEAAGEQDEESRQDARGESRGTRRWRGRRRGLRGRARQQEENSQGEAVAQAPETAEAEELASRGFGEQAQGEERFASPASEASALIAEGHAEDSGAIEIDANAAWDDSAPTRRRHERGRSRRSGREGRSNRTPRSESESLGGQQDSQQDTHQAAREYAQEKELPEEPAGEPILLPGESLARYGGGSTQAAAAPTASVATTRPSTLIEAPVSGWDGGFVLPGETLSRRSTSRPVEASAPERVSKAETEPEVVAAPLVEAVSARETASEVVAEPAVLEATHEVFVHEASVGEESAHAAPVQAALVHAEPAQAEPVHAESFHEEMEETTHEFEPSEVEPSEAAASYRVDPSAPSEFRIGSPAPSVEEELDQKGSAEESSIESREAEVAAPEVAAPEVAAEAVSAQPVAEQGAILAAHTEARVEAGQAEVVDAEEAEGEEAVEDAEPVSDKVAGTLAALAAESGDVYGLSAGIGIFEEEELDEDEFDFGLVPEAIFEDHEIDELEEETLDQGVYLGEFVRDTHLEERLSRPGAAEDEAELEEEDEFGFAEPLDESEHEAEDEDEAEDGAEEQPAAQPSRREGRKLDRRRGRQGNGRQRQSGGGNRRPSAQTMDLPIISELLKQGQEILVQIAKEPIAKKGARITSHIALPGRFLVFMPTVNHVGVSRKISSDEERQRLKRILISEKGTAAGGFIVRTAADGASEEELRADLRFLIHLWAEIKERADAGKAPSLIYHDLNLIERILRDQVSEEFSTIWVDSETDYERIVRLLSRFQPSLVRRVKLYTKETPLFEQFGIQEEITRALRSKVWLKSGGSIVINQTEALVAIDINTGKYVGKTARLEDTIVKTNLDAIPEIVRQIRLRDLGGIIVIDFIDMDERKNRHKVLQALEDELRHDRAPSKVLQFNDFGLVAITRKRVKQSLERTLSVPCTICTGTGMVKSPTTVANEIYIEMRKMQRHLERNDVLLRVHPEVVKTLKANGGRWLNDLEEITSKTIIVKSDPTLHPEQFDIQ